MHSKKFMLFDFMWWFESPIVMSQPHGIWVSGYPPACHPSPPFMALINSSYSKRSGLYFRVKVASMHDYFKPFSAHLETIQGPRSCIFSNFIRFWAYFGPILGHFYFWRDPITPRIGLKMLKDVSFAKTKPIIAKKGCLQAEIWPWVLGLPLSESRQDRNSDFAVFGPAIFYFLTKLKNFFGFFLVT